MASPLQTVEPPRESQAGHDVILSRVVDRDLMGAIGEVVAGSEESQICLRQNEILRRYAPQNDSGTVGKIPFVKHVRYRYLLVSDCFTPEFVQADCVRVQIYIFEL